MPRSILRPAILLAVLLVACLPLQVARGDEPGPAGAPRTGIPLEDGAQSHVACRLVVQGGDGTAVDRGWLPSFRGERTVVGAFRLWREPAGRMLYLYDDAQNLVARVVNPEAVVLLGADEPAR